VHGVGANVYCYRLPIVEASTYILAVVESIFMKLAVVLFCACCLASALTAQEQEGVLARCGASDGHGFFFKDEEFNPGGSSWKKDAFTTGRIILVKLGEEWDIQFDDALGAYGYRQDGADVLPLMNKSGMLSIGAFHSNYIDIYTFDFADKKVAWSSNKLRPYGAKVAAYVAICE
jgi:hypothetical protein